MRTFLWVVLILDQLFILMISAADLKKYELTDFQAKETWGGKNDERHKLLRKLHRNLHYVKRQQQLELTIAFAVGVSLWCYLSDSYLYGIIWALLTLLLIMVIRRMAAVKKLAYELFENMLSLILSVSTNMKPLWWLIGLPPRKQLLQPQTKQEIQDLLIRTNSLSAEEKHRFELIFEAEEKTAQTIMTKKNRVVHVQPNATLGPVLLAELQKSGHGYFPVITKKGQPEGVLRLAKLDDIQTAKQKVLVQELMDPHVLWVDEDMNLTELAKVFLAEKNYLMLVRTQDGVFTGVVTIADLIKHLTGISS